MHYKVEVDIMPLDEILDPQGKVVNRSLSQMGLAGINDVRIGKHIEFDLEADSKESAEKLVDEACSKLLANVIIEKYHFKITELSTDAA